jgi:hypothetical protein
MSLLSASFRLVGGYFRHRMACCHVRKNRGDVNGEPGQERRRGSNVQEEQYHNIPGKYTYRNLEHCLGHEYPFFTPRRSPWDTAGVV